MDIYTLNKKLTCWLDVPNQHEFSIYNLPLGIFETKNHSPRIGVALGDTIIDISALEKLGYLKNCEISNDIFLSKTLNPLIELGKNKNRQLRNEIAKIFSDANNSLQDNKAHLSEILVPQAEAKMLMPIQIGDYTDFYSSKEHATNVGTMFRDPNNALLPNWLHIPVGYHGRASSIVESGISFHRPKGQTKADDADAPSFGPSKLLDFELEMAFVSYSGKQLGEAIDINEAEDYIFGMVLFNDWSARDIQKWEYVPLGPFLAKNFISSISPWIVSLDALEPFRVNSPEQNPEVLPYLKHSGKNSFDINLEAFIAPENGEENRVCKTNFKYMYWSMAQQLAHHTVNGCNIKAGDLYGSGTISGPTPDSYGSMLELAWRGTKPIKLKDGSERKFILDGDTVILKGSCSNSDFKVGFGQVSNKVLPAK